jgi:hypothetical protein
VDSSLGSDLWCFAGSGTPVNIDLTDVYHVSTSGETNGLMTYTLHNGACDSEGKGGALRYLTPNIDVDFGDLRIRICSIQLD